MQQQEMAYSQERELTRELAEGEELLWSSRPNPSLRRNTSGATLSFIILTTVFGIIGILFCVIGTILIFTATTTYAASVVAPVFYILGSAFLFFTIFFGLFAIFYKPTLKNTLYAITNQRIIIMK